MLLAGLLARRPDELRADFQRFYGLNLDDMGVGYTTFHAAALAAHLPHGAATWRAEKPELEWSQSDYILALIEHGIRVLCWQNTEDGRKGRNQPKRIPTPLDNVRVAAKAEATDMERIAAILGLDMEGGGDG